jgi:hypothetical protein
MDMAIASKTVVQSATVMFNGKKAISSRMATHRLAFFGVEAPLACDTAFLFSPVSPDNSFS